MPRERCLPHPQVQICGVDTRDSLPKHIKKIFKLGHIPASGGVVKEGTWHVCPIHGGCKGQAFPVLCLKFIASFRGEFFGVIETIVKPLKRSFVDLVSLLLAIVLSPL